MFIYDMLSGIPIGLLHNITNVCNQNSLIVLLQRYLENFKILGSLCSFVLETGYTIQLRNSDYIRLRFYEVNLFFLC